MEVGERMVCDGRAVMSVWVLGRVISQSWFLQVPGTEVRYRRRLSWSHSSYGYSCNVRRGSRIVTIVTASHCHKRGKSSTVRGSRWK